MNEILTSIFAFRQSKAPLFDKTTGLLPLNYKKILATLIHITYSRVAFHPTPAAFTLTTGKRNLLVSCALLIG